MTENIIDTIIARKNKGICVLTTQFYRAHREKLDRLLPARGKGYLEVPWSVIETKPVSKTRSTAVVIKLGLD